MDRNILVSIIVPVYKVELYLEKCIQSILAQTYSNIEIILIDDGSPDCCGEICDAYRAKYSRIKCVHIPNSGASVARNTGIDTASGDFILFVDSDDWINEHHVENLLHVSSRGGLGACSFLTDKRINNEKIVSLTKQEGAISVYSSNGIGGFPVNKIYDRKLIEQYHIRFDSRYTMCEDLLFNIQYVHIMTSDIIQWNQKKTYYYRTTVGAVRGRFQKGRLYSEKDFSEYLAIKESQKYIFNPEVVKASHVRLTKAAVNSLRALVAGEHAYGDMYHEMLAYVRQHLSVSLFSPVMARSSKLSTILSAISPKLEYRAYLQHEN